MMFHNAKRFLILATAHLLLFGCGQKNQNTSELYTRSLTKDEARADLEQMASTFKALYGPLKYKEARFNYAFDDLKESAQDEINRATSDEALLGVFTKFATYFDDAHISVKFPVNASGIDKYSIPVFVEPIENKAIVTFRDESLAGYNIDLGDQLISVDGQDPFALLQIVQKYRKYANPISSAQALYAILSRPFYMAELKPTKATAVLVFEKANGARNEVELTWRVSQLLAHHDPSVQTTAERIHNLEIGLSDDIQSSFGISKMGSVEPFFLTKAIKQKFQLTKVVADAEHLKKFGADPANYPEIYAALYRYKGKTMLLLRQPGYSHDKATEGFDNSDHMKVYQAILSQYEPIVDGLVIDQTHNGGGSYCEEFFTMFIQDKKGAMVQRNHADRKWIFDYYDWSRELGGVATEKGRVAQTQAALIEQAYDRGDDLSEPLPLMNVYNLVSPYATYTWKKPFMVLVDELSASCADAFPMLVKNNGVAKIFGERTMGAGGNVEDVIELGNSRAKVRLTRGMFTSYRADGQYGPESWIENNGVTPDYHYSHTVSDYRAGYVSYFETFSDRAIEQLP